MKPEEIINALEKVPEYRLRLVELAWKLVNEEGKIDLTKIAFYHQEIVEAIEEAEAYRKETKEIRQCLLNHFRH